TRTPIDWEKCPYVPRPSLITDPITAFGQYRSERNKRQTSILDPINRAAIRPDYEVLHQPIKPYIPARDKNRERILNMVRQHIDTVDVGGNTAARTSRDSLDIVLPRKHRAASESLPIKRETYRNEKSGALTPRLDLATDRPGSHRTHGTSDYSYSYKSSVEKSNYDSSNPYSYRPERSSYQSSYESSARSGPGGAYNYSTERTSTTGGGPGGYSYSSTTSGVLPGGTRYRHYSYRV
ncbi:hypothetical protein GQX74_015078, partial [Glossina fuscipes]